MKISSLRVINLFSYADSFVKFDDYNVILGLNSSGKTNLIRLLKFLTMNYPEPMTFLTHDTNHSIDKLILNDKMRYHGGDSSVTIGFTISSYESQLLTSLFCHRDTQEMHSGNEKYYLTIYWKQKSISATTPDYIFLHFPNKITMWFQDNVYYFSLLDWNYEKLMVEDYSKYLSRLHKVMQLQTKDTNPGKICDIIKFEIDNDAKNKITGTKNTLGLVVNLFSFNFSRGMPMKHVIELFNFCKVTIADSTTVGTTISLWNFLEYLLRNSIVFLDEFRSSHDDLTKMLYYLEKRQENRIKNSIARDMFHRMFPNITFEIFEKESRGSNERKY